jgi:polyferredoxin
MIYTIHYRDSRDEQIEHLQNEIRDLEKKVEDRDKELGKKSEKISTAKYAAFVAAVIFILFVPGLSMSILGHPSHVIVYKSGGILIGLSVTVFVFSLLYGVILDNNNFFRKPD